MIGKRYEYDVMAKCERELWWYRCLHELTLRTISRHKKNDNPAILDAGCGTGELLLRLKENGYTNLSGFDFSADAVAYTQEKSGIPVQLLNVLSLDAAIPPGSFDIIISHDMICFLPGEQDKKAIDNLLTLLKPGGLLLMNLPALRAFYGTHDVALGMQHRYSKKMLRKCIGTVAEIREFIYWPFILSPMIFFVRAFQRMTLPFINKNQIVSDVKMPAPMLNKLFYALSSFENKRMKFKPWGSSLFVVIEKRP